MTKDLSKSNKTIAIDDSDEDKPVSALIAKKIASTSTHPSTNGTSKSSSDGASSGHKAASHQSSRNDGKTDSKTSGTKHGTTSSSSNGVNKDAEKKKPDSAAKDDSDSEDDMPFVEIIKKREREAKDNGDENSKKKKKTSEDAKNRLPAAPKSQPKNGAGGVSTQFYEECSKGTLVQTFIVRWWYAIEWPIKANIPEPPKGFESLDGYPGVFVSTQVSALDQMDAVLLIILLYRRIHLGKYWIFEIRRLVRHLQILSKSQAAN